MVTTAGVDDLLRCLVDQDVRCANKVINEAKRKEFRDDFTEVLNELWRKRCDKFKDVQCSLLNDIELRLEVSSFLVQEVQNGYLNQDLGPYNKFAIDVFNSPASPEMRATAIRLIGVVGFKINLKYIREALASSDQWVAISGMIAFSKSCYVDESNFLEEKTKITRDDLRGRFDEIWIQMRLIRDLCVSELNDSHMKNFS